ncbi:MAG TPA: hypothetical protein VKZ63_05005 [Kofleriaceae bacterium]|nr:hypothetical protein [Kofleriaceae bacterium]
MLSFRSRSALVLLAGLVLAWSSPADAQRRRKPKPATQADIERLEKKIAEQQKVIDKLVQLQKHYLQALSAILDGSGSPPAPLPEAATSKPEPVKPKPEPTRVAEKTRPAPKKRAEPKKPEGRGIIVGKIAGASDAIVYVDGYDAPTRGATATMKQEGKRFLPRVLVVRKGTKVSFPNLDAFFHNVFSVTPGATFDLGSYPQGDTRTVRMWKTGVVTVYCNMHPQMVGYVLVVPNRNYVRAGKDGFFRIPDVPAGNHRVVAWAPNAKAKSVRANVVPGEVVTVELALEKRPAVRHNRKDGLPYGSYDR